MVKNWKQPILYPKPVMYNKMDSVAVWMAP